jgi:excisionase family DNA binding protein
MEASDAKGKLGLLTLANVVEYLHLHRTTIYRMVKRNQLQGFKLGGEWRFNPESIERWRADAERNANRAGSASGCTNDSSARATSSSHRSAWTARSINQLERKSRGGQPPWSGWPRLTDP